MTTSRTTTFNKPEVSRGQLSYICNRNQHQAHDLLVRAVRSSGLTQKQLAERAGIDEASLSRLMRRPRNVEIDTLSRILYAAVGAALKLTPEFPRRSSVLIMRSYDRKASSTRDTMPGFWSGSPVSSISMITVGPAVEYKETSGALEDA